MVLPSAEEKEDEGVAVVGFIRGVVAAIMRCFFGCFRSSDSHSCLNSTPSEPTVSDNNNALSSLFLSDDDSLRKGREDLNSLPEVLEIKELESEAKFLKARETSVDTPVEIRKAPRKWMGTLAPNEEPKPSSFKSWILSSSSVNQPDGSPTHVRSWPEWMDGAGYLVGTPSSCTGNEQNTAGDPIKSIQSVHSQNSITLMDMLDDETYSSNSSVSPKVFATSVQGKYKSVRFECESENSTCSPGSSDQCLKQSVSACNHSLLKASPYPTPLKLTDDMQTPGTVFPAYMDNMAGGKTGRLQSQYVSSIWNPIDCPLQRKESEDENSDPNHKLEALEPTNAEATPIPTPGMLSKNLLLGMDSKDGDAVEALEPTNAETTSIPTPGMLSKSLLLEMDNKDSNAIEALEPTNAEATSIPTPVSKHLSLGVDSKDGDDAIFCPWLMPNSPNHDHTEKRCDPPADDHFHHQTTPWDSHIVETVAANWTGNGLPNTTNKYKETLSEEILIPQSFRKKKPVGGIQVAELNEADQESDSASSGQYSSARSYANSIVSF